MTPDQLLLMSVVGRESGGNPKAVSPAGAQGIVQIMPATARDPGFGIKPLQGWDGQNPMTASVEEQLRFGNDYLQAMKSRYGSNELALAAYNAGPGAVEQYNGIPPYQETQNYVKNVTSDYNKGMTNMNQGDWRSRAEVVNPAAPDTIQIPQKPVVTNDWRSRAEPVQVAQSDWRSRAEPIEAIDGLVMGQEKEFVPGTDMGRTAAAVQGFNSAVPFGERVAAGLGAGMAYGYENIADAINGRDNNLSLGDYYDSARENQQATENAHGGYHTAGAVTGLAATLPMLSAKAIGGGTAATTGVRGTINAIPQTLQGVGNYVRGSQVAAGAGTLAKTANLAGKAGRAAIVAAPTNALYSYGASENDLDSTEAFKDAGKGALVGAAIGGAVPVASAAVSKTITSLADKVVLGLARKSGEVAKPILNKAEKKVYARLEADLGSPESVTQMLQSYVSTPGQALIVRSGKTTANLAEGANLFPTAEAKGSKFFADATSKAPEKVKKTLNKTISKSDNFVDDLDTMVTKGREKAAPLYKDAFANNQAIKSPVIDKILKTPEGKAALSEAAKNMQNEMALVSKPDKELTKLAREAGIQATGVGIGDGLKLRTLDYVKRAMDDNINKAIRAGDNGEVARLTNLKKTLVAEVDKADKSGLYAKARAASGDYLSSKKSMESGLKFLSADSEEITKAYKKMGPAEKKAYKAGVVRAIRKDIDGKYDGMNVAKLFDKPSTQQKLKSILSPEQYDQLYKEAEATDKIFKLRNQITGGSPTAKRQIAAEEFNSETQGFIMDVATKGASRAAFDKAGKIIARQFKGMSDKSAGEVADILYTTDPQEKYKIVQKLTNLAKNKNPEGLEAGKKLKAFYKLSDAIKISKAPVTNRTEVIITPPTEGKNAQAWKDFNKGTK